MFTTRCCVILTITNVAFLTFTPPPPPKRTEFGQQNFTLNGVWNQVLISDNIDERSHTKPLAQDDQVYHCNPCRC